MVKLIFFSIMVKLIYFRILQKEVSFTDFMIDQDTVAY
jgi:hypothetical protein